MRTRLLLALLLLSFLAANGHGQQQPKPDFDGYWWASLSPDFKVGWVSGYAMAMEYAFTSHMATCIANMPMYKKQFPNVEPKIILQKMCLDNAEFDYDGVPMGQFVDGVNTFYSDYRNKQLEVGSAIQYARDEIKGKPAQELEAEVTMWRACTAATKSGDKEQIAKACTPETPPYSQPQ